MDGTTQLTIQEKNKKKGLTVTLGRIWASMVKQDKNMDVLSPHGAAAIEGTDFVYTVDGKTSTCSVVNGKVLFFNDRSKVHLKTEQESSSTSSTGALTPAQKAQLRILTGWQKDIMKYYEAINAYLVVYEKAKEHKEASGTGSLKAAQDDGTIDRMKELTALISSMVPDENMRRGHGKILGAFDNMKNSLIFPDPKKSQEFFTKAQQDLAIGQAELNKYKSDYDAAERKFISTGIITP